MAYSLDYNGLPRVLQMAQRIDTLGLDLMLDIHYSDTWADSGNQTKPSAWEALDFETLSDSVFHYTKNVVTKFKAQGTLPKFIQIGNETDCGFLWPDGYVCDESNTDIQWQNLGILFNYAISGIQEAIDETDTVWTIGHLSSGGIWFFQICLMRMHPLISLDNPTIHGGTVLWMICPIIWLN